MSSLESEALLIILAIGVVAPLLVDLVPRLPMPVVVLELGLGIVVGPQVLDWAQAGPIIRTLSNFGIALLFFLAGFEIDFNRIRGRPITLAFVGWLLSVVIALAVGHVLERSGLVVSELIVMLALTTTALGTLLPILRDARELETRFGVFIVAIGAVGEVGPIVLVSLLLTTGEAGGMGTAFLMALFTVIAVLAALLATRLRPPYLVEALRKKMHTSAQLPLRGSILILAALVLLSRLFGLDAILGAAAAGIVVALATEGEHREILRRKFEGIAYGLFVPIFFIASGMRLDIGALFASATAFLRLPLFLLLFLVIRGLPVLLYRRDLPRADLAALAFLSATALPLVVAITHIGVETDRMRPENAAALVGAAMISVFLYPLVAIALRRRSRADPAAPPPSMNDLGKPFTGRE